MRQPQLTYTSPLASQHSDHTHPRRATADFADCIFPACSVDSILRPAQLPRMRGGQTACTLAGRDPAAAECACSEDTDSPFEDNPGAGRISTTMHFMFNCSADQGPQCDKLMKQQNNFGLGGACEISPMPFQLEWNNATDSMCGGGSIGRFCKGQCYGEGGDDDGMGHDISCTAMGNARRSPNSTPTTVSALPGVRRPANAPARDIRSTVKTGHTDDCRVDVPRVNMGARVGAVSQWFGNGVISGPTRRLLFAAPP